MENIMYNRTILCFTVDYQTFVKYLPFFGQIFDTGQNVGGVAIKSGYILTASITVLIVLIAFTSSANAAPGGPYAYVTNFGSHNVSVIDIATNTIATSIPVGSQPRGAELSPDETKLYVANWGSYTVSVIDTATNTVTSTISVGHGPRNIVFSPDGTRAYVTNDGSDSVSVIDTATNTVTSIPVGDIPNGIAITPDGTRVYVTNFLGDTVSVINTATNEIITTITVADSPLDLEITPDGTRAYVINSYSHDVSVINTGTNTVTTTIPLSTTPMGIAITPDGARAYVTNEGTGGVSVIDIATNTVLYTIGAGSTWGIGITPDGTSAYVTNAGSDSVLVIHTATDTVEETIPVGDSPTGLTISQYYPEITVTTSPNPSVYGQSTTFTATVTGNGGTPTGTATFLNGGSPMGTATLSGGVATFSTSTLATGSHTITAGYSGDSNYGGCTNSLTGVTQVVNKADTTLTLTSSRNPGDFGEPITFTATVVTSLPGSGTPAGAVTFNDGGSPIETATLSGGVATFTTSTFSAGSYTITASYGGDGNYTGCSGSLSGNPQVILPSPPVAGFTANVTSGTYPLTILFTDTSIGSPTSWQWNFGDGKANGTVQYPVHTYVTSGTYTVTFTATNAGGSGTIQKSGLITVNTPTYGPPLTISMADMYNHTAGASSISPVPTPLVIASTPTQVPVIETTATPTSAPTAMPLGSITPTPAPTAETQSQTGNLIIWLIGLLIVVILVAGAYFLFFRK